MGVPRLFKWLRETNPRNIYQSPVNAKINWGDLPRVNAGKRVDNFYIDAVSILHQSAGRVFKYGNFALKEGEKDEYEGLSSSEKNIKTYSICIEYILSMIRSVDPSKLVYISFDGVAPLAKQGQQRQRRFVAAKGREESKTVFDSNCITAGSSFTYNFCLYAKCSIIERIAKDPFFKSDLKTIFSSSNVPGEGEHKIMDYLRETSDKEEGNLEGGTLSGNLRHVLYGPDGDLIMLALCTHRKDFWIVRENFFDMSTFDVIDMGSIYQNIIHNLSDGCISKNPKNIIHDFVLMCFFLGNDFLPKLQMVDMLEKGIETFIDKYKKIKTERSTYTKGKAYDDFTRVPSKSEKKGSRYSFSHDPKGSSFPYENPKGSSFPYENPKGSSFSYENPKGSSFSYENPKGSSFSYENPKGSSFSYENPKGSSFSYENPKGSSFSYEKEWTITHNGAINTGNFQHFINTISGLEKYFLTQQIYIKAVEKFVNHTLIKSCTLAVTQEEASPMEGKNTRTLSLASQKKEGGNTMTPSLASQKKGNTGEKLVFDYDLYDSIYTREKLNNSKDSVVDKYYEGLNWILQYYVSGCPDWRWIYPYHYAPLMKHMSSSIQLTRLRKVVFPSNVAHTPFRQMMCVIPPLSESVLHKKLKFVYKHPNLQQCYPSHFEMDYEGKKQDWQGIALLPFVNQEDMDTVYEEVREMFVNYKENRVDSNFLLGYTTTSAIDYKSKYGEFSDIPVSIEKMSRE